MGRVCLSRVVRYSVAAVTVATRLIERAASALRLHGEISAWGSASHAQQTRVNRMRRVASCSFVCGNLLSQRSEAFFLGGGDSLSGRVGLICPRRCFLIGHCFCSVKRVQIIGSK